MVELLIESGAPINALEADGAIHIDSARFVWFLSQDDEEKESFGDIITIIKDNGGVSADYCQRPNPRYEPDMKYTPVDLSGASPNLGGS